MARKPDPGALIHCEYCGEDYSATYRRCPFCGEKPTANASITHFHREEPEDDYIFEGQELFNDDDDTQDEDTGPVRPRGGKRLAQDEAASAVNLPRLITFICSLVMIVAAVVIVFAYIYPMIHDPKNPSAANSPPVSDSLSPASGSPVPSDSLQPTASEPVVPSEPVVVTGKITGVSSSLRVRSGPGTDFEKVGVLKGGAAVTVLDDSGGEWYQISFTDDGKQVTGYVPSKYVKLDSGAAPSTAPSASETPAVSTQPSGGKKATIINASTGLRVRSGPGISFDVVGSLRNGSTVTVVADAGGGWSQITFGSDGKSGYIMNEYIDGGTGTASAAPSQTPAATPSPAPSPSAAPSASPAPTPSASPAPSGSFGGRATIVNAAGGLRVRSGPGIDHDVVGSLRNGNTVDVVEDAGNGWYEITFTGPNGSPVTGYIKGEYFSRS